MSVLDILRIEWPSVVLGVTIFIIATPFYLLIETAYNKWAEPWLLAKLAAWRSRRSRPR
jgi:hypothetical protein